ncbi:hypothetical protein [Clostridium botulinum]|nr:hypothetical protein [Clostridium botulinum]
MSIWTPICWISGGHEWEVFRENKDKVILRCNFCGRFKTIYK